MNLQQRILLGTMPNVLIVHLQRITTNFETWPITNEKINTRLEFPPILDLNRYSFKTNMEGKVKGKFEEKEIQDMMEQSDDNYIYRLVGVNVHRGSANRGHYWSLIHTKRGAEEPDPKENEADWLAVGKDSWKKFDDDETKYFSFRDLEKEAFGGDGTGLTNSEVDAYLASDDKKYGKSAYMLVYERKTKKQIREVRLKEEGKADPPVAIASQEPAADVEMAAPAESAGDGGANVVAEEVALVDYRSIQCFIPEWIRTIVSTDNTSFVVDR